MRMRVKPSVAICPLCGEQLTIDGDEATCDKGHSFNLEGWGERMDELVKQLEAAAKHNRGD